MGRRRIIDQERVLDAAQAVVARDGTGRLTLDAIAAEAGVSKASVLYDYKSKDALVEAVVRRAMAADNALNEAAAAALGAIDSQVIRGRIAAAAEPVPSVGRAAALALCAALAQDARLRAIVQENQAAVVDAVVGNADEPRGALLAYLALEGLKTLESLDLHTFSREERGMLLREIGWLAGQRPVPGPPD